MRSKRGQVMLFIIVALVIVALAIFFFFIRKPGKSKPSEALSPEAYLQDCINLELEPAVEKLASQGGYLELGNCIFYRNVCRHYLCYTTMPYKACVNQEPLLKEKIESILKEKLQQENVVKNCINNFAKAAKKDGYEVSTCQEHGLEPSFSVILEKGRISFPVNCTITLKKVQEIKFENFDLNLRWPLYEFVVLAKEIINEEITNTDFDPVAYMLRHYWVEIEKFRTSDDSKIYTLRDRNSKKEFVFAVRNYVLSPGVM
ncbi:MAG: hypothetical protein QXI41_02320 [Candidatus Pacearchaeota archaeon]